MPLTVLPGHPRCPRCAGLVDGLASASGARPSVGALVVCTSCASVLTVTPFASLRELRDAEFRALPVLTLHAIASMQRAIISGHGRERMETLAKAAV
jgi:hypothetical protein